MLKAKRKGTREELKPMAINPNPTYTIEFPLSIPTWQQHRLEKKLKIARTIYNSCLGEALKRHKTVKSDEEYRKLLKRT